MDQLVRLHRPMQVIGGELEEACVCLGGIYAEAPADPRPCGCWGLLPPVCGSCSRRIGDSGTLRTFAAWPCDTAKAIGTHWWWTPNA
jgi:hypothetical protein